MNRIEYWLLHSVVEYRAPLHMLADEQETRGWLGYCDHGAHRQELESTLHRLCVSGDIMAQRMDAAWKSVGQPFVPSLQEIQTGFNQEDLIRYGLTSQGGAIWEKVSNANWGFYRNTSISDNLRNFDRKLPDSKGCISMLQSMNQELIEWHMHNYSLTQHIPLPGTQQSRAWRPWQVTYWKTLPVGYRLIYQFKPKKPQQPQNIYSEYCPWSRWYTAPELSSEKS